MKKFFTLIAVAAMAFAAQATDLTVFDGTNQNEYIPFRATYFDWSPYAGQVIYPADQLTDLVGKDITGIKFYIANENGNVMNGGELSVYLGATDNTAFPSYSPSLIPESNLTLVGATSMTAGETEIVFNFTTPFTYNGGNLALMVSVTTEGTYSGDGYFYGVNAETNVSAYGWTSVYTQTFYPKTTFTYEGSGEEPGIATLAEANALEDAAEFTFDGDAVVTAFTTYQNVSYLFVRDESGYGMFAGVDGTFENGQVLSEGWTATKTSVNDGWVRYIDAAGLIASGETNAELAAAQKLTAFPDESMINAFVCIENQKKGFPPRSYSLPDGTTISRTEVLGSIGWSMSQNLNVYGVICKVDGVLKLNPLYTEVYVEPQPEGLRGDVNDDEAVDINDVTALIDYLLGVNLDINTQNADCDLNNAINIDDVTTLIDYLLTGVWPE